MLLLQARNALLPLSVQLTRCSRINPLIAKDNFQKALHINPDYAEAHNGLAMAYLGKP